MADDSEFRAYPYILKVLGDLGWDTKSPRRGGQVYTQGEFRRHDSLLTDALGRKAPENVVVIPWDGGPRYWIIEAKPTHRGLNKALGEAQGYADRVNIVDDRSTARFATGIAGTPDQSFYVRTTYWDGSAWQEVAINNFMATGFLTLEQCLNILSQNSPRILDYDVNLDLFLAKANDINKTLHANAVAARDRAKLVAGLLLALAEDSTLRINRSPRTLVGDVNSRIESLLDRHRKVDFLPEVQLKLPANNENHRKYWSAIVETMQHLREMNIRSAINSGTDALGQFYETFLKYANDASEMGIVLTPRHITRFAVSVLHIQHEHAIYDPTCGTGGFLVAALDTIRASHHGTHPDVYDRFRNDFLHGIEQADDVFGLALVNMIFRGDGKSRIHNGNCFDSTFIRHNGRIVRLRKDDPRPEDAVRPFARVLMNPPFAMPEPEHEFVNHALEQTQAGGLLFAILPNGPITGQTEGYPQWRKELVKRHTVKAAIKMQRSLFHPSADKVTYALILEAWRPHRADDAVFFAHLFDNLSASRLSKWVNVSERRDNVDRLTAELRIFMAGSTENVSEIPTESGVGTLDLETCDFAPEAYLTNPPDAGPTPPEGLFVALTRRAFRSTRGPMPVPERVQAYGLDDLFNIKRGEVAAVKYLPRGDVPIITTTEQDNGIEGYYALGSTGVIHRDAITITVNGSGGKAFWHPYSFAAVGDVLVCQWRPGLPTDSAFKLYVCDAINRNAWRFSWSRKGTLGRLLTDVQVVLPMKGDRIDFSYIRRAMKRAQGYDALVALLDEE
ncbi:MAG: N-6 DNA methylase [Rhodospirillaceae bacterium]|nr:N-6 DNA methylase [Rhodospirillaceae bacterium]MDE0619087.1 N-6 DNA methylase [Rhodospirillaceae bacterium]